MSLIMKKMSQTFDDSIFASWWLLSDAVSMRCLHTFLSPTVVAAGAWVASQLGGTAAGQ